MPRAPAAATPMAFIRAMVAAYERYGVDPAPALREAQIAPRELRRTDARITAVQMETFSGTAMQQLDDEALGWFSRRLPWGSYGLLCRASITAPTLHLALRRWCRHHGLLTDDVRLAIELQGAGAAERACFSIEEAPRRRLAPPMREICFVTLMRYLHGFACWAIDSRIPLLEARFPYPPPPHREAYPLFFPSPRIVFHASRAEIAFDARYLALPLRRDERALQAMLQRALLLTVRPYRRDRLLASRVRARLAETPGATAPALAAALHVSVRTLHRQLREEGTSLQAQKDALRRERASALLLSTTRPVKQIAREAGFRSEKSFARAFAAWTGRTPSAFRRGEG